MLSRVEARARKSATLPSDSASATGDSTVDIGRLSYRRVALFEQKACCARAGRYDWALEAASMPIPKRRGFGGASAAVGSLRGLFEAMRDLGSSDADEPVLRAGLEALAKVADFIEGKDQAFTAACAAICPLTKGVQRRLFRQAHEVAMSSNCENQQCDRLCALGQALVLTGHRGLARNVLRDALSIAEDLELYEGQVDNERIANVARGFVCAGYVSDAIKAISRIRTGKQSSPITRVARSLAAEGHAEVAMKALQQAEEQASEPAELGEVAAALIRFDLPGRERRLAGIIHALEEIESRQSPDEAWRVIADAYAESSQHDLALEAFRRALAATSSVHGVDSILRILCQYELPSQNRLFGRSVWTPSG